MSCTAEHPFGKNRTHLGQSLQIAQRRPVASPLRGALQDECNVETAQLISKHREIYIII